MGCVDGRWWADPQGRGAAMVALAAMDSPDFAWLDGGIGGRGYLGDRADFAVEGDDPALFDVVDRARRADPSQLWVGTITYDFAADLVRGRRPVGRALPGLVLRRYGGALEFGPAGTVRGHGSQAEVAELLALLDAHNLGGPTREGDAAWPLCPLRAELSASDYRARVRAVHAHLVAGDSYQVNFAQEFTAGWTAAARRQPLAGRVAELYRQIRARSPAELGALVRLPGGFVVSNSPETLLRVEHDAAGSGRDLIRSWPIKGTRPRGATAEADARAERELIASAKDRAEHVMIVDLIRSDLGRIAVPGTVTAGDLATLLPLATVHHLVTEIRAELQPNLGLRELVAAMVPGGSVTGAPKRRTLEIIEKLETGPRGVYCGAIVVLSEREIHMSVPIRTGWLDDRGLLLHAGGGIVIDSDPEAERLETLAKVRAFEDPRAG